MTPRRAKALRDAWRGPRCVGAIGRHFKMTPRGIRLFWQRERDAGRLPDHARPHFKINSSIAQAASGACVTGPEPYAINRRLDREIEREIECGDSGTIRVPPGDPLLAALRRHHGDDSRRDCDSATLDDRKHSPSPAELLALARNHDARAMEAA